MDFENVPHLKLGKIPDPLRDGLITVKSEATSSHPLQLFQKQYQKQSREQKMRMLADVLGTAYPLRLQFEEAILSSARRLPGLESSFVGLDTMSNADETFSFEDYLGDPTYSDKMPVPLHDAMEARLGLQMPNLRS